MANIAKVQLITDAGEDLAARLDPRLVALRLSEKRGGEADELQIDIQNHDGAMAMPTPGRELVLSIGWAEGGREVPVGLVGKGRFKVDEVEMGGPPDMIAIRARSADLSGDLRKRRTKSWRDTTLGALLGEIAARHGRSLGIAPDLSASPIKAIEQEGKSDMQFVRDLGSRYDAIATWKDTALLFLPIGSAVTASGLAIPGLVLRKRDGWTWRFTQAEREKYDGAEAQYHDPDAGRRKTVKTEGENRRKLKRVYASEDEARQAAESAQKKAARMPWSFTYDLAIADPAIQPDQKVTLQGWNSTIDGIEWLIESIETTFDGSGLVQSLTLESA